MTEAREEVPFSRLAGYTPKQIEAVRALNQHKYVLYGGARGGGKSRWLRWVALHLLLRRAKQRIHRPRFFLFCEDYPTLEDRQISKISREFPPSMGQLKSTATDGLGFYLNEEYGGGVLCLRNLDDPSKYAGAEFCDAGIDELTRTSYQTWQDIRGSLRWPGVHDPHLLGATMPGGPGHLWVKQLWIDQSFPEELYPIRHQFAFVQALATDNPHNSPEYIEMLRTQPEARRRAWLEGDWNVFEGQVFTEWRDHLHVVRGRITAPKHWRWIMGLDWGVRANGWAGLVACGPKGELYLHWDWAFKDLYANQVGEALSHAFRVLPHPEWIAADEQMWYKVGTSGPNLAEEMQEGLRAGMGLAAPPVIAAPHGRGSRATKLDLMHKALAWRPLPNDPSTCAPWARPKLRVHERCRYFRTTIPALAYDKLKVEDVDTKGEDHAYDGFGNILLARVPVAEDPGPVRSDDQHPGTKPGGGRRSRDGDDDPEIVLPHQAGPGMYRASRIRLDDEDDDV